MKKSGKQCLTSDNQSLSLKNCRIEEIVKLFIRVIM